MSAPTNSQTTNGKTDPCVSSSSAPNSRIAHPAGKSLKSERRMDNEAMRVANGEPWWWRRDWCDWLIGAGVGILIFLTIFLFSMSAAVIGGWVM